MYKIPDSHLNNVRSAKWAKEFLGTRVAGFPFPGMDLEEDAIFQFLPKRPNSGINQWLVNTRLPVLYEASPQATGCIQVNQERISHVLQSRAEEGVPADAVEELLVQLFVTGGPSYSPNSSTGDRVKGYDHQLMMFIDTYKSKHPAVSGKSPAAVLGFVFEPKPHLKLITAYWVKAQKAKALRNGAL